MNRLFVTGTAGFIGSTLTDRLLADGNHTLKDWAARTGCPAPDELAPQGRFSIVEGKAFSPLGTVRHSGRRLKLCEDGNSATFVAIHGAFPYITWNEQGYPGFWLGDQSVVIDIHNGTGAAMAVDFRAAALRYPGDSDAAKRTFRCHLGEGKESQLLEFDGDQIQVTLDLLPGLNQLTLRADDPADRNRNCFGSRDCA